MNSDHVVRAVHCEHTAGEQEIYNRLSQVTEPLTEAWDRLARARQIVIKVNMMESRIYYHAGRRQELVDDAVARALFRLLRERTGAELVAVDTYIYGNEQITPDNFNYAYLLQEYGVRYVDVNRPPFVTCKVPGGGSMFDQYTLNRAIQDADEIISLATLKNHLYMGVTLCTKNLFGLPPTIPPEGRTRSYYHHLIRLPYVLVDLGLITRPCLNIIDGLVGQTGREWRGRPVISDTLIAGNQVISTDACAAFLMGHDPRADWPVPPFRRDRNHLLMAAERGFGTVDPEHIDFVTEVDPPLGEYEADELDAPETVRSWRRTACEQGLYYRDHQAHLTDEYAGQFIYIQDGQVVWNGNDPRHLGSRRQLAGNRTNSALWLKYVDPEEREGEYFERYQECLDHMGSVV